MNTISLYATIAVILHSSFVILPVASWSISNSAVRTVPSYHIDAEGLSITSFVYNSHRTKPDWIEHILGNQSVFYDKKDYFFMTSGTPVSPQEFATANTHVISQISLNIDSFSCSIEMLGFVNVDNQLLPFDRSSRSTGPIVGTNDMYLSAISSEKFQCHYRALFENWRPESDSLAPHFWSTVFFCPIQSQSLCSALNTFAEKDSIVDAKIEMSLLNTTVKYNFTPRLFSKKRKDFLHASPKTVFDDLNIGICAPLPYVTSDSEKHDANAMMLSEWIKYYVKLGIKVFIYDRNGSHERFLSSVLDFFDHDTVERYISYYNYTMHDYFNPDSSQLKYDNNERDKDTDDVHHIVHRTKTQRIELQGHDKVKTLTHCRFEAKATHGVSNMIVADFDEFLYCPRAASTALDQAKYMKELFDDHRKKSSEQLKFSQLMVTNTTASTRDCVVDATRRKVSLLPCFASYHYVEVTHSFKSVHLGHNCPLTGYHTACATSSDPRSYDCNCNSELYHYLYNDTCTFLHYSTNKKAFARSEYFASQIDEIRTRRNEVHEILYS